MQTFKSRRVMASSAIRYAFVPLVCVGILFMGTDSAHAQAFSPADESEEPPPEPGAIRPTRTQLSPQRAPGRQRVQVVDVRNWQEGDPIPPGYVQRKRMRTGLVVGGASILGGLWVTSIIIGSLANDFDNDNDWVPMYIPVAGPFITIGTVGAESSGATLLALNGIGQTAGLTMLILGLTLQRTVLVPTYTEHDTDDSGFEFAITPTFGARQQGLSFVGRF